MARRKVRIIECEISHVLSGMKSSHFPSSSLFGDFGRFNNEVPALDSLFTKFKELKDLLKEDVDVLPKAGTFLGPFLDVMRTDSVSGPVTGITLDALNQFISHGLLDPDTIDPIVVDSLADAVTHTKFVGVDTSSDEIVLMKILEVLRSLFLSPVGHLISDETAVIILQSTFRIAFEARLSELLRKFAERVLKDLIQALFSNLSLFRSKEEDADDKSQCFVAPLEAKIGNYDLNEKKKSEKPIESTESGDSECKSVKEASENSEAIDKIQGGFVNHKGITFTQSELNHSEDGTKFSPFGIRCIKEVFRFLISLTNSHESHEASTMGIALSLIRTALESGGEYIYNQDSLVTLVKENLSRNVVSLLKSDKVFIYSQALWIGFLLFSDFRHSLKFQMEIFLQSLMDIVTSESIKATYDHKELALDLIVRLYKLPDFITQVYINYDCDLYASNLFEDLTKILSKNTYPVSGLYSTNFLSLEALTAVIDSIESQCTRSISSVDEKKIIDEDLPNHEQIMTLKHRKKLINTATEQFNAKPSKGVSFMQDSGLLSKPLNPQEIAAFLKSSPHIDKKQLGEYMSNRKNLAVLEAFVTSFNFADLTIDECLRMFLETFRLPGEAPLITLVLEHFADHWQKSNGNPLDSADSAFTLAYAVIMLNVDQHNVNHTKTNEPMTVDQFCKNLRGTDGGKDHDQNMLKEVYKNIKTREIVMPAEQTGIVKENYIWKCVLARGEESKFFDASNGTFDHELFSIVWGPTVASLCYIFDRASLEDTLTKALVSFSKFGVIAAHYFMSDVLDSLIISLSKFTTLLSVEDLDRNSPFVPLFGANKKALAVTRLIFLLAARHGDIIRKGWKIISEIMLQLFRCGLLPESIQLVEDFFEKEGVINLYPDEASSKIDKTETSFIDSFVSFISMASETGRVRTSEEEEAVAIAHKTIKDCNVDSLITESKFLTEESLLELTKAFSDCSGSNMTRGTFKESLLASEVIIRLMIENKDRALGLFSDVLSHLTSLLETSSDNQFILERATTNVMRLCIKLARKEELVSPIIRRGLQILFNVDKIYTVNPIIAYGLHELLRNYAANIHESEDWAIIFRLLETVGCGSDEKEEEYNSSNSPQKTKRSSSWIFLDEQKEGLLKFDPQALFYDSKPFAHYDSFSFFKCTESLSFLIRDAAHITPENFEICLSTLRTFIEASYFGAKTIGVIQSQPSSPIPSGNFRRVKSAPPEFFEPEFDKTKSDDENDSKNEYTSMLLQTLDLLYTLHSRAADVYSHSTDPKNLWTKAWCPILQSMARLCLDHRAKIRSSALTTLHRSFLFQMSELTGAEWESVFTSILFPMLAHLMKLEFEDKGELEETRTRSAMLLGKVFLQHLVILMDLQSFESLYLTVLDFMEKLIKLASSDLLVDAVPESIKNMLLVMDTAGVFMNSNGPTCLWYTTWDTLENFLPGLMKDIFTSKERVPIEPLSKPDVEPERILENEAKPDQEVADPVSNEITVMKDETKANEAHEDKDDKMSNLCGQEVSQTVDSIIPKTVIPDIPNSEVLPSTAPIEESVQISSISRSPECFPDNSHQTTTNDAFSSIKNSESASSSIEYTQVNKNVNYHNPRIIKVPSPPLFDFVQPPALVLASTRVFQPIDIADPSPSVAVPLMNPKAVPASTVSRIEEPPIINKENVSIDIENVSPLVKSSEANFH